MVRYSYIYAVDKTDLDRYLWTYVRNADKKKLSAS